MEVGLIECGDEKYGDEFQREIMKQAEAINFKYKRASDLFNVLGYAKSMADKVDYLIIIAQLDEKKEINSAFYEGLAELQVNTGKQIFKLIFEPDESVDIIEFANEIIDFTFKRERAKGKKEDDLEI